jgi:hypothetical protein
MYYVLYLVSSLTINDDDGNELCLKIFKITRGVMCDALSQ